MLASAPFAAVMRPRYAPGKTEGDSTVCSTRAPEKVCQSENDNSQLAAHTKNQDAVKKRLRLQRTQRLEEDQSKSSSSTGGLSADESKLAPAIPAKGQVLPRRPSETPAVCWKRHRGGTCGNPGLRQWVKSGEGWLLMIFRKPYSDYLTWRGMQNVVLG